MATLLNVGNWAWSQAHQQYVKVIESSGLWGQSFYRVWLQQQDSVVKVSSDDLSKTSMNKSPKQVHEYNKHRFDDLLFAGWDLIVIDEAHRLGESIPSKPEEMRLNE